MWNSELFELTFDLLATLDRAGRFTNLNHAAQRILGYRREELIGRHALDLIHPDDDLPPGLANPDDDLPPGLANPNDDLSPCLANPGVALSQSQGSDPPSPIRFENRYRCKDGSYRWLLWNARPKGDTWYVVAQDITDQRRLADSAIRDPLTGLPNRAGLTTRLQGALARLTREPGRVAVLFVDLDGFKHINDTRGHTVGDGFLRAVTARLLETVRDADAVARLGGDEFVVLLDRVAGAADAVEVAERIERSLSWPLEHEGEEAILGASIGIAMATSPATAPESLLREADIAMYRAKRRGGRCYSLFDHDVRAELERRLDAERALRVAVNEAALVVHFQPIVRICDGALHGCEALVRWRHPTRGLLAPRDFLPLAEETGMILPIGRWVLGEVCRQAARWRQNGADVTVGVNVSVKELDRSDFPRVIQQALNESGIPASTLCLEIAEPEIASHLVGVAARLRALREIGVRLAIDNFGSGSCSLNYLRTLPLDVIKIDSSLVRHTMHDLQDRVIVGAIAEIGRAGGCDVIAEGVETLDLHADVAALGCGFGQGFLYDAPRPASEIALEGYRGRVAGRTASASAA